MWSRVQAQRHTIFYMKNRLDTQNINIVYCPTGKMLVDVYMKPLQGSLFHKFRDIIVDIKRIRILKMDATVSDQERVGNAVETGLNKPLPTEINKSDHIANEGHDVEKTEIRKYDASINKSVHRK